MIKMNRRNLYILFGLLFLLLSNMIFSQNNDEISSSFIIDNFGKLTSEPSKVVSGKGSIVGEYFGDKSYNWLLKTNLEIIKLSPNETYRVVFSYRVLKDLSKGSEVLFFSQTGADKNDWVPSYTITGHKGKTGTAQLTVKLKDYNDYIVLWNIIGTGSISIDNIEIINVTSGKKIAVEDGENIVPVDHYFPKTRSHYYLDLNSSGTEVIDKENKKSFIVSYGKKMVFLGSIKYSKNTQYIIHNVRSHAEMYENWESASTLPVDFLRTYIVHEKKTSTTGTQANTWDIFPDKPDKVIVGYINSMMFTATGGNWDPSFNKEWDLNNNGLIDSNIHNLPGYVDVKVFDKEWKSYVAVYWDNSWKEEIKKKIDIAAEEHLDGIMLDVMTGYLTWKSVYPDLDIKDLKQKYVELFKWISSYARETYGTAFLITANIDGACNEYFPDLGKYIDGGYYQNAFFIWDGSGVIVGYGLSKNKKSFKNPAIDFLREQGLAILDMEHIGTGKDNPELDFTNYNKEISKEKFMSLFQWAIKSGSTPYLSVVFMDKAYSFGMPRFVRILPNRDSNFMSEYSDWVIGSEKSDSINTGIGDDMIYGGPGDDKIDGGEGDNSVFYLHISNNYIITKKDNQYIVKDKKGVDGVDTLINIQNIIFKNKTVNLIY